MRQAVERFFQFSLLGLVSAGFLAVAGSGFLDTPTVVLVSVGLFLRGAMIAGLVRFELPGLLVNVITLGYIAFFAADYFFLSRGLLEATVHLVCFLAVMKILTAETNRDYLYTASIALVELVAAAMLSVNLNFFAYLAVYLVCAIAASTSAEIRRGLTKPGRVSSANTRIGTRLGATTAFLTSGILLLTVAMFILLPRSANAALRRFLPARYHLSGFSNEVTLGDVGQIQKDNRAVMHIRPYSQSMPRNLKWRGAALSHFDGRRWTDPDWAERETLPRTAPIELAGIAQRRRRDGSRFSYLISLNPTDSDVLFLAATPEFLNIAAGRVVRTVTGSYRISTVPSETLRYEGSSFLAQPGRPSSLEGLTLGAARRYLAVPPLDPRIAPLARTLGTPARIERYLHDSFGYTLDLPDGPVRDPLANFLFDRKKGHCEYFASAMAIMLRTLGTPARIVNGFQSGTFNPVSGLYVVRASDAHSWVEAWLPGQGWTVFDPTPTVPRAANPLSFYVDAAETLWQEWVVDYDLNHQIAIAERLQETAQRIDTPHFAWPKFDRRYLFLPLLFLLPLPFLFRARRARASQMHAPVLYRRMLKILKARGYEKPAWFTAAEFARSLPPSPLAQAVEEFTLLYQAFRYGGEPPRGAELDTLLNRMPTL